MAARGFMENFLTVTAAIRARLATALLDGSLRKEDFAKLASVPDGMVLSWNFRSAVIDLLAGGATVISPTVAGYYFIPRSWRFQNITTVGTHTNAGSQTMGNNGTTNNLQPAAGLCTATGFGGGSPGIASLTTPPAGALVDLATPISFNNATPPTITGTGAAWTARIVMEGCLYPV